MSPPKLTWVSADGGPHVLLPAEASGEWTGIRTSRHEGRSGIRFRWSGDAAAPASDYDAACDMAGLAGLVQVGIGEALVLGDEVPMSTWVPSSPFSGGVLIVPMTWPDSKHDDSALLSAVAAVAPGEFLPTGLVLRLSSGRLLLCAAADYGPDWRYPTSPISIPPGEYQVRTADVQIQGFWLRLHALDSAKPAGQDGKLEQVMKWP